MKKLRKLLIFLAVLTVFAALAAVTALGAEMSPGIAKVGTVSLNMRSGPGCDYSLMQSLPQNANLVIIDREFGFWYRVNYNGTEGYVARRYLKDATSSGYFIAMGETTTDNLRVRSEPTTDSAILKQYNCGKILTVLGIEDGWFRVRVDGISGFIRSDYIRIISEYDSALLLPDAVRPNKSVAPYPQELADPIDPPSDEEKTLGEEIAAYAQTFLGTPYVYGGWQPGGFDCSGLVYYVYLQYGYSLYHGSTTLYNNYGAYVSSSELLPGDLVFFDGSGGSVNHVGIYIGDGQFIHAPDVGEVVRINSLSDYWYAENYYGARRIIGYETRY